MRDIVDFLGEMIANHLEDESLQQGVAAFMRDYRDSESTADFAHWADGETPESASKKMTQSVESHGHAREWIADDDMEAFVAYIDAEELRNPTPAKLYSAGRGGGPEEPNPSQENCVRRMEDRP